MILLFLPRAYHLIGWSCLRVDVLSQNVVFLIGKFSASWLCRNRKWGKRMLHMRNCCFADEHVTFWRSRCNRRRLCKKFKKVHGIEAAPPPPPPFPLGLSWLDFLKVLRLSFPSRSLARFCRRKHKKSTARASRSWKNLSSTRRQVYVGTWSASWQGYNPLILWRPCVMRERGPYNVGRAVQTDPTLLRHAVRRSQNKRNVGSCWFKSLTGCKQHLFFVSFLTHFVWQTIVIHHQLLVKRIRHTT